MRFEWCRCLAIVQWAWGTLSTSSIERYVCSKSPHCWIFQAGNLAPVRCGRVCGRVYTMMTRRVSNCSLSTNTKVGLFTLASSSVPSSVNDVTSISLLSTLQLQEKLLLHELRWPPSPAELLISKPSHIPYQSKNGDPSSKESNYFTSAANTNNAPLAVSRSLTRQPSR